MGTPRDPGRTRATSPSVLPPPEMAATIVRPRTIAAEAGDHLLLSDAAPDADAELIRLCTEHFANLRAFNLDPADSADDDPLWQAFKASESAISALQPRSIDGVLAKARLAKLMALESALGEDEETWSGDAAWWAREVVHDLLRLHGETVT